MIRPQDTEHVETIVIGGGRPASPWATRVAKRGGRS